MNKPYTCHNCSTVFDAYPDSVKMGFESIGEPGARVGPMRPGARRPDKLKVRCPGCYNAGYTAIDQMVYTLDISGDAALVSTA